MDQPPGRPAGSGDTPYEPDAPSLDEPADRLVATAVEEGLDAFDLAGYSLGAAVAVRAGVRPDMRIGELARLTGVSARLRTPPRADRARPDDPSARPSSACPPPAPLDDWT
ncbi:alpha/beta fold hydrolase [Kitasatospora sp. NPDC059327]|uniref:alpha/beta fold hydrolase n=1 Tax=Kitasatospora sp. NPDC059327 TaxID=3346803 RepID=UPI0036AFA5EC